MVDLRVHVDNKVGRANWTEENPTTRAAIESALPIEGNASRWGEELYFTTGIDVDAENASATVPVGAIAYWPAGNALCIFWGPTPASEDETPRAASPVNVVAQLEDTAFLESIDGGARVRIEQL